MFSVVIPLYNKELSIRNTLQSVLDQTFEDYDIIVINDGSTDNSASIVEEISDPRIRLIHQENLGVSTARNRGINEARKEWIALLDGDDLWLEDHLSTLADMIKQFPEEKVFATSYIRSNENLPKKQDNSIEVIEDYFKRVVNGHFVWTGIMCIHKQVFEKVGNFNTKICRGEDLDQWARIGHSYKYIKSKKVTALYKIDSENRLTGKKSNYHESILSLIDLKNKTGYERKYFRNMLRKRIITSIRHLDIQEIITIISKHNIDLLK